RGNPVSVESTTAQGQCPTETHVRGYFWSAHNTQSQFDFRHPLESSRPRHYFVDARNAGIERARCRAAFPFLGFAGIVSTPAQTGRGRYGPSMAGRAKRADPATGGLEVDQSAGAAPRGDRAV